MAARRLVYKARHSRGHKIAGLGCEYHVHMDTGELHAISKSGRVSPEPGVREECAAYLLARNRLVRPVPPPAPAPPPAPEPESPAPPPAPEEDDTIVALLTVPGILDKNLKMIRSALASGDHDTELQALLILEEAGKGRSGALEAIRDRIDSLEE